MMSSTHALHASAGTSAAGVTSERQHDHQRISRRRWAGHQAAYHWRAHSTAYRHCPLRLRLRVTSMCTAVHDGRAAAAAATATGVRRHVPKRPKTSARAGRRSADGSGGRSAARRLKRVARTERRSGNTRKRGRRLFSSQRCAACYCLLLQPIMDTCELCLCVPSCGALQYMKDGGASYSIVSGKKVRLSSHQIVLQKAGILIVLVEPLHKRCRPQMQSGVFLADQDEG